MLYHRDLIPIHDCTYVGVHVDLLHILGADRDGVWVVRKLVMICYILNCIQLKFGWNAYKMTLSYRHLNPLTGQWGGSLCSWSVVRRRRFCAIHRCKYMWSQFLMSSSDTVGIFLEVMWKHQKGQHWRSRTYNIKSIFPWRIKANCDSHIIQNTLTCMHLSIYPTLPQAFAVQ